MLREVTRPRAVLALIGGVLLGLAFPQFNFSWAAWIAFIPLFMATLESKSLVPAALFGLAANAIIFEWVIPTCRTAQVNWGISLLAWAALAAYHALYIVAFSVLMTRGTNHARHPRLWPFQAAALWTVLEYIRAHALSGFPWTLLANTQWKNIDVLQIAEITGPYGVGFLIILFNAGLATVLSQQTEYKEKLRGLLHPVAILLLVLFWGHIRLISFSPGVLARKPSVTVAILQGNINQYQKWDDAYESDIRTTYDELMTTAMRFKPDLIVWPETAVPGWYPNDVKYAGWVWQEGVKGGTYQLIGAPTSIGHNDYNAAFLVTPEGIPTGRYLKNHLVPFGEYVPLRPLFAPWIQVLNDMGNFSAGNQVTLFHIPKANFATSICFEAIFPDLIRRFHNTGAQFLVNITNDGWFLDTSAPEQHMVANVLRAIENRTFVVRAANTGISCIIQPSGRVQAPTPLLTRTVLVGEVTPLFLETFYDRWGDLFAWLCLLGFSACLIFRKKHA